MNGERTNPTTTAQPFTPEWREAFWLRMRDQKMAEMLAAHNLSEDEFLDWLKERLA